MNPGRSWGAPTNGCFTLIATQDGTPIKGAANSAEGFGSPRFPATVFTVASSTPGVMTTISLSALSSGSGSGTFRLDDGDTGTIAITSVTTVNLPLSRIRKPH